MRPPVSNRLPLNSLPLYLLLFTDVLNGVWTLLVPTVSFSGAALMIKAAIALMIGVLSPWSASSVLWLSATVAAVTWSVAGFENSSESTALALKAGSVITLLVLLERYQRKLSDESVHLYLIATLLVIAFSLVAGLLGIGHDRYLDLEAGLRRNGFLAAGNEINIGLVGIFWWLSSIRSRQQGVTAYSLLYWLCLTLMIICQSKTTVLGALLIILYFHRLRISSLLALVSLVPIAVYLFLNSAIWARWIFFYGVYADEGVMSAATGGRFGRIDDINVDVQALLFDGASILASGGGYIESDPIDLLFNFGLAGLLLYAIFAARLYVSCRPHLWPWCLIIGASVFAGHVTYSVFAAPILFATLRAAGTPPPFAYRLRFKLLGTRDTTTVGQS